MNREERREFVRKHRTAGFGSARKRAGSTQSVVYYLMDGEDIRDVDEKLLHGLGASQPW